MKTLSDPRVRQSVVERLNRLPRDCPARWGKMTAHQMICHLADSFKVPSGEKQVSSAPPMGPPSVIKWIAIYVPVRWPKGLPTRPEVDQLAGGTRPTEFDEDRKDLIRAIERFTTAAPDFAWHPHPVFDPMPDRDWMRWGYLHADHHLRQFGA